MGLTGDGVLLGQLVFLGGIDIDQAHPGRSALQLLGRFFKMGLEALAMAAPGCGESHEADLAGVLRLAGQREVGGAKRADGTSRQC